MERDEMLLHDIKTKYIKLLRDATVQVKEEAIQQIAGLDMRGVFELEDSYNAAICVLDKSLSFDGTESASRIIIRAASESKPLAETCREIVAEHRELWASINYALCSIEAESQVILERYMEAKSEAELLLIPAPAWPDVELLQQTYRHSASVS